jgi:hypothetical protein
MRLPGHRGLRREVTLLVMAGSALAACTGISPPQTPVARTTVLTCRGSSGLSAGADPQARWVGGVGSPALYGGFPGSSPAFAVRQRSKDGHQYFFWKDPLAVAPTAQPYRTITVVSPPSARLLFATPSEWATLSGTVLPILGRTVRLSACGRKYASYFGAIMVRRGTCVTLTVSGPSGKLDNVTVPILVARC